MPRLLVACLALLPLPAAADWPETIEPTADTYMGEPFLGPLG